MHYCIAKSAYSIINADMHYLLDGSASKRSIREYFSNAKGITLCDRIHSLLILARRAWLLWLSPQAELLDLGSDSASLCLT